MAPSNTRQWFWQTIWAYWAKILAIFTITFAVAGSSAAFPIVWQMIVDKAMTGAIDNWLLVVFVMLFIFNITPLVPQLRSRFLNRYEFETRYQLFRHLIRLSIPFHKDKESTKALLEVNKGVAAGNNLLSIFLQGDILADIPVSVFALWYVGMHSIPAVSILLAFIIFFLILSYVLGIKITNLENEYNDLDNDLSTHQREVLQYIETVKLHQAEPQEEEWALNYGTKLLNLSDRRSAYYTLFNFMSSLASALPFGIAMVLFLPGVANGSLTVGTLIALQMFSVRAVSPAGFLGSMYHDIKTSTAKLKPALILLQEQPSVKEAKNPVEMNPLKHEINICNLSFTYQGAEKPTLNNVSLSITAGEKVALVGKTGSGKTTLARMLVRFYDPNHGIITMDGTDLRHVSFGSLYRQVSYVTQEVPIFSGTIGHNVKYGLPKSMDDHITLACTYASADFVFNQKKGLETRVGEMGENLSGGERQRVALARVFLRRPSVVILDEATAALDRITEHEVQEALDRLFQINRGITMVVIAHRITTVKNANRIVVMDKGYIIDTGTHDELMGRCELYQELCKGMAK